MGPFSRLSPGYIVMLILVTSLTACGGLSDAGKRSTAVAISGKTQVAKQATVSAVATAHRQATVTASAEQTHVVLVKTRGPILTATAGPQETASAIQAAQQAATASVQETQGAIALAQTVETADAQSTQTALTASINDLAYKMATIQDGGYVDKGDPLVSQFAQQLTALAPHCQEPVSRLGDFTVFIQGDMKKRAGIDEDLLSILTHVTGSIPAGLGRTKCSDIFAAYETLRIGG